MLVKEKWLQLLKLFALTALNLFQIYWWSVGHFHWLWICQLASQLPTLTYKFSSFMAVLSITFTSGSANVYLPHWWANLSACQEDTWHFLSWMAEYHAFNYNRWWKKWLDTSKEILPDLNKLHFQDFSEFGVIYFSWTLFSSSYTLNWWTRDSIAF